MNNYSLLWPTDNPFVTQQFGTKGSIYGVQGHTGLDLRVKGDDSIEASEKGTVVTAVKGVFDWYVFKNGAWVKTANYGKGSAFGNHVAIDHGGYFTFYGHLATVNVKVGDKVEKGHNLGHPGNTGQSKGAHLHYELRVGENKIGKAINALPYMNHMRNEPADPNEASDWAKTAQLFVKSLPIPLSDGSRPHDAVTREEIFVMMERLYQNLTQK